MIYLMIINVTYAGTKSVATITAKDKGVNLTLPSPYNENAFAGTLLGTINSGTADFYCIDIKHLLDFNTQYQDVNATSSKVTYILNNYYPYKHLPYDSALSETNEAAAVQLAIWGITDTLNIAACVPWENPAGIVNRALEIVADANQNGGVVQPFKTLVINILNQSFTIGSTVQFNVEAYNEVGAPVKDAVVHLSVNEGTLSETSATTDSAGVAGPISLTAGPNNSTIITATGMVTIPGGTEYFSVDNPDGKQKLVIATPVNASKTVTASVNWWNPVSLSISKTSSAVTVNDGDKVDYNITITNTGTVAATGIQVSDVLPHILSFVSADGNYNPSTGIWSIDSLGIDESKTLKISVDVNFNAQNATLFDLGVAADYNVFVLNDINQPSSDTEGRMAVGRDAVLARYSVGDKLQSHDGDVLVVGRKLTYISGRVFGGIAFGSFIDTTHWDLAEGTIHQDSVIDFNAASVYLNNLSSQMSVLDSNGTVTFEYGMLTLTGTNPQLNKFTISGSDLSQCNTFTINVPQNSVVLVNVSGDNIVWENGYNLVGATNSNVLFNFYEAKSLTASNIYVMGSILAPQATLNFPSGLIGGQCIAENIVGAGQFNNDKFNGKITLDTTITNFAEVVHVDQPVSNSVRPKSMAQVASVRNLTGIKSSGSTLPLKMDLLQNYPNPFNPTTQIMFSIAKEGFYTLKIYNMLGQEVATLASRQFTPGNYNSTFNASSMSSGIYIYQLKGNNVNITKKMTLLK